MSGFRILIVEDNPDTVELLTEQLDDPMYEIFSASDGQEAILKVGERAPDLIIMDVMMPHLDGFETSRYLKRKFRDVFLPIIVLSAKSDAASQSQGAKYGCEDYQGKPYQLAELQQSIEALLELSRLENALLKVSSDETKTDAGTDADSIVDSIVDARFAIAKRLANAQKPSVALNHLKRILELSPEHEGSRTMMQRMQEDA